MQEAETTMVATQMIQMVEWKCVEQLMQQEGTNNNREKIEMNSQMKLQILLGLEREDQEICQINPENLMETGDSRHNLKVQPSSDLNQIYLCNQVKKQKWFWKMKNGSHH